MLCISNFALDLYNIKLKHMKKSIFIIFVITSLALITSGLWFFSSLKPLALTNTIIFCVSLALLVFSLFIGLKKLGNVISKEPIEDEFSKIVVQKSATISYFVSIGIWSLLLFFSNDIAADKLLAIGMLGMGVTFGISWLIMTFNGIKE